MNNNIKLLLFAMSLPLLLSCAGTMDRYLNTSDFCRSNPNDQSCIQDTQDRTNARTECRADLEAWEKCQHDVAAGLGGYCGMKPTNCEGL